MKTIAQILTAASATIFASNALAEPLSVGAAIPVVEQKNQDGNVVKLAEVGAKGFVLVFFYPKADTPGCTKQACSLRDSYEALSEKSVKIFGVSADKEAGQKAFKDKYKLPFELLADADAKVIDAFGVPKTLGFAKRQAFLFKDGKLVWSDLSASTEKQAEDVLKYLAANPG
ncbi:MAG: peroxiredoxin [Luteolibacter sp.]